MTNKELGNAIRKELKAAGITSKDVSVRVRDSLYDTAVNIKIKNPKIRKSEVEEIVKKFEKIDRDERTYEILAGCNVYILVDYESVVIEAAASELLPIAEMVMNNRENMTDIRSQTTAKKALILTIAMKTSGY